MTRSSEGFVRTAVIGGLVVIVPIAVLVLLLGDLFTTLVAVADPVARDLPFGPLVNTAIVWFLVAAGILLVCFLTGLVVSTGWGHAARAWFERTLLGRLPLYGIIKNLTHSFAGSQDGQFAPAEVDLYDSGCTVLGAIVEELPDGRVAVFVPLTPVATVGQVHLVPAERITRLDASLVAAVSSVSDWGAGTGTLVKETDVRKA